ncbi:MAG: hypothetical protein ABSG25_09950 [Bryobacteraceae bacterium]|jgi:uncharacterized protein (DUF1778 family)
MTSADDTPNLPLAEEEDKPRGELGLITARVTEAERQEIDIGCARLGVRRAHFVVAASVVAARAVEAGDEALIDRIRELAEKMAA